MALLREANNEKRKEGKILTLRTDDVEQQNMKMLDKIAISEDQI